MTIQDFNLYTARGYEGDLVDSGPRVVQTGILTSATAGFGKAMKRDTSIERGVALGTVEKDATETANVYAISQREYNHEAGTRPSTGDDTNYLVEESVSLIRQGYVYISVDTTDAPVVAGEPVNVTLATGVFSMTTPVLDTIMPCLNVIADDSVAQGSGTDVIIKARIDIVA